MHARFRIIAAVAMVLSVCLATAGADEPVSSIDTDGDGRVDRVIERDAAGNPVRLEADTNHDGWMDVVQYYRQGNLVRSETDTDFDRRPDKTIYYDGSGLPVRIELDSRQSGRIDRIEHLEDGLLTATEEDIDGDGYRERRSRFSSGRMVSCSDDRNRDGKADLTTTFGARGEPQSVEADDNLDGRTEIWQFYHKGVLQRMDVDQDSDGRVDLRVFYANGERIRSEHDSDSNGYFERVQTFEPGSGNVVVEIDSDENAVWDQRHHVQLDVIRKKEVDQDQDGRPDLVEYFDGAALRVRSEERPDPSGCMTLVWHFDDQGLPARGEMDSDYDGRTDIWIVYRQGLLARIEEDTNRDGRPDLWETYDAAEQLVWRARDLDFDGSPDLEDRPEAPVSVKNNPIHAEAGILGKTRVNITPGEGGNP